MDKREQMLSIEKPEGMSAQDELAWALCRVLRWPNPDGTIEQAYIPGWLAAIATDALTRHLDATVGGRADGV
jgi:hypothetical protein